MIIVINTHSFVDVMTNSSCELFVCDTDKSLEFVKKILKEIEKEDKYASFDEPFILTQEVYDEAVEEAKKDVKYSIQSCLKTYKDIIKNQHKTKFPTKKWCEERLEELDKEDAYIEQLDYHMQEKNIGKIVFKISDENCLLNKEMVKKIEEILGPVKSYYPV